MKNVLAVCLALAASIAPISAGFSEKRLESAKKQAATKGRLVAFLFEQAYYNPNCPTCIADVNANNSAMKKAIPRKHVELLTIDAGDSRDADKLPQCVRDAAKGAPVIILTDSACEKVVAVTATKRPDRKQAKEFEEKAAEALGK